MAENPDPTTQDPHEADEVLKKRLLSRVAIAGVIVVALLGGLAVIDALYVPPPRKVVPSQVANVKTPEPEAVPAAEPAMPASETAQADKNGETPPEVAAEPERTAAIALPPPRPERPLTPPASARSASLRPGEPIAAPQRPDVVAAIAHSLPPAAAAARHAPPSRPLTQAAAGGRQFVVQMGVFSNVANAEELRARLELAGVPAQIEARVQVGPFASRQEADSAREKLRALGLEPGILAAIRK